MTTACRMVGCMSDASPRARFCATCAVDYLTLLGDDAPQWGLGLALPEAEVVTTSA